MPFGMQLRHDLLINFHGKKTMETFKLTAVVKATSAKVQNDGFPLGPTLKSAPVCGWTVVTICLFDSC